mgnify:FL=1
MRAREFIVENTTPHFLENNLIDSLDSVRNRFRDTGEEPKISLRALVTMVRGMPGSEMFNVDLLKTIYDKSTKIKNMIASVKDDENGVKSVFIRPVTTDFSDPDLDINNPVDSGSDSPAREPGGSVSTVDKMAKRAAARRK